MQIKKLIHKIELNTNPKANEIANGKASYMSKKGEISLLALCLFFASALLIYCTTGGLIWTSDSFQYWAASRSFQENLTFVSADGGSYVFWPPLFPIILSFFAREGSYYIAHIVLFNLSLLSVYLFIKRWSNSIKLALGTLLIFCLSLFPYLMASFFWTEILFTFFLYSGIYFYLLWKKNEKPIYYIGWIILLASMCLQRNAGIFIMTGLAFYELNLLIRHRRINKTIINGLGILISVVPNLSWNFTLIANRTGSGEETNIEFLNGFFTNIYFLLLKLFNFLLPVLQSPKIYAFAFIIIVIVLIYLCVRKINSLVLIIFLIYLILLACMPLIEPESMDRFIAPVLPLFIFLLLETWSSLFAAHKKIIRICILFLLSLTLIYNTARTLQNVKRWHQRSITNPKEAKIFF